MFDQLVESRPTRERRAGQTVMSIVAHSILIIGSVHLTRAVARISPAHVTELPMMLARAPHMDGRPAPMPARRSGAIPSAPAPLPIPVSVGVDVPPVVAGPGFDPRRFGEGSAHGTHIPGLLGPDSLRSSSLVVAMLAADEQSRYLDGPPPRYPPVLRQSGIEGWAQVRFIVGLDGRAEAGSIDVVGSSHASFEAPAIEAIAASRFLPARLRGRSVRQLVEQVVRFKLR